MADATGRSVWTLRRLAMALPIIFLAHVLEEAPTFVEWFNSLVARGISKPLFLSVNVVAGLITLGLCAMVVAAPGPPAGILLSAWVGFLMLANAAFHLAGVVTATLLYIPAGILTLRAISREARVAPAAVLLAASIGAIPMVIHGYLIVFRGSRLF
jgi:hypothetical protein